ncbi:miro-like family protein [Burkholderia cepacia]|uniref:dynamin family protein n=1 Tax=Burkholderia cepacia TaxID=292 RepID=UPI00298FDA65|nr:dynamin family protein [Burkholderia cepacia]MDW9233682.1 miro-like family protein [Burkholderia cepacia]
MTTRSHHWIDGAGQLVDMLEHCGDDARASVARLLLNRLTLPQAYVTVVGETSTGKSSLINALLGQDLLPSSARPTTGVVTHVACRDEAASRFFAIYRDATQETIEYERFRALSEAPEGDVLRLQVRTRPKAAENVGLHVFDTPGYNAVLSEHEEVLMNFLPNSDVIVFVVGYRTGFGQSDQDLLEAIAAATAHDTTIPLVLAINRVPEGCGLDDKRVAEIRRLAEDGIRRPLTLQLVASANGVPIAQAPLAADELWDEVRRHAFDSAVLDTVHERLQENVLAVLDDADAVLEREEAGLSADAGEAEAIVCALDITRAARAESLIEIERTMANLDTALPRLLDTLVTASLQQIEAEILGADKWLGFPDCAEWVASHCLPFEVRRIGRQLEAHMEVEMVALNRRLEEIANTAIGELDKTVSLRPDDPVRRFTLNVSRTIAQRLAGNAVNAMLKGIGGVGGAAAGAGNLAKMALKRLGELFGQRFGREVYDQIGRIFTKRLMERLSVAVTVIVEIGSFVYEAQVWQRKLIEQSREAVGNWRADIDRVLRDQHLPSLRASNEAIVHELYGEFENNPVAAPEREARLADVQGTRQQLASLRSRLTQTVNP